MVEVDVRTEGNEEDVQEDAVVAED